MVVAQSVVREICPTIAVVHDQFLAVLTLEVGKESRLSDVGKVGFTTFGDKHFVFGQVRSIDVVAHEVVGEGTIPTIDVGGIEIIFPLVLKHAVSFTTGSLEHLMAGEQRDAVSLSIHTDFGDVGAVSALRIGIDKVGDLSIGVDKQRLVTSVGGTTK